MSEKQKTETLSNRKFKITKGHVGPWNAASKHVFDENEFRRLNPIPKPVPDDIDPETYHSDLLARLLGLGVIAHAPDDDVTPTPIGPESSPANPVKNAALKAAVENAIKEREAAEKVKTLPIPGEVSTKK